MNDLLDTLSESRLPALPSERSEPAEPREPIERQDITERGRSPEEVIQSRETRLPAEDERRYEVGGVSYTAKELEKSGRLEDLTFAQAKYAQLQDQYNQLIAERQRAQAPAPPAQITNEMIAAVYDQVATVILNDLVNRDLIEADIADAYPRSVQTLVGQLRFAFDKIAAIEAKVDPVIAEITAAKWKVQANVVLNAYNQQLDALVAKDQQLYAGLKSRNTRDAFTEYLVEEVGATVGQTTGESASKYLARQWAAFNSDTILDAAKSGVQARRQRNLRRNIIGEGTGSRTGVSGMGEESMIERMIRQSEKIPL